MARPLTFRSTVGLAADVPRKVTVSMGSKYGAPISAAQLYPDEPRFHVLVRMLLEIGEQLRQRNGELVQVMVHHRIGRHPPECPFAAIHPGQQRVERRGRMSEMV